MPRTADLVIAAAHARGQAMLDEQQGKTLLADYGIPTVEEKLAGSLVDAKAAAREIGYPVALKVCDARFAHKTEAGLIALRLRDERDLAEAFKAISGRIPGGLGDVRFLVQKMVSGARELVIGMNRDAQFGPAVMFGLGGIFTEALADVAFRLAPLTSVDAADMIDEIAGHRLLGRVRGMAPVCRETLIRSLVALGTIAVDNPSIRAIDVNPLIVAADGRPVAVDALVILDEKIGR